MPDYLYYLGEKPLFTQEDVDRRIEAACMEATKDMRQKLQDAQGRLAVWEEKAGYLCAITKSMTYGEALITTQQWRQDIKMYEQQAADYRQTIKLLEQRQQVVDSWIRWEDRQPVKGEAGWVVFLDELNGQFFVRAGSNVEGEWWHYRPLAWQPKPELPAWITSKPREE